MEKILVIGASGQLGTDLVEALRVTYGSENVIPSDIHERAKGGHENYEQLDILDQARYHHLLKKHGITQVYHLAAMLSAKAETNPQAAWTLNMESLLTVLESGREQISKIFWPSSIAVFGQDTPKDQTPQNTIMNPSSVYGISKLAGERWCDYYYHRYDVDVRSLRYPGLIGFKGQPGGGTTDYAVDVFWKAVQGENFDCFLKKDTRLPMMFMDDAVRGTIELMEQPAEDIGTRSSYNMGGINFTPEELFGKIALHFPEMNFTYSPDFRQAIADSWPNSIDDSEARKDWGWNHQYDLSAMTSAMIEGLNENKGVK